jgi:hypothetical protein
VRGLGIENTEGSRACDALHHNLSSHLAVIFAQLLPFPLLLNVSSAINFSNYFQIPAALHRQHGTPKLHTSFGARCANKSSS